MKTKSIILFVATILILNVTSCKKATFLTVDIDSVYTTISGTEGDIKIETDGGNVEIVHIPQWIKTNINENHDTLHYVVELNTDRKFREDSIVLRSSDITCRISVSQSFKATFIKFTPEEVLVPSRGGTEEVMVEVDGEGALTVDHSDIARVEGRKIFITLTKNQELKDRTFDINVTCDEISASLKVTQKNSKCQACNGTGYSNRICPDCNGVGVHACCNYRGKAYCDVCGGSGVTE